MNILQADIVEKEYGSWPSFHDAEVMRITLSRGKEPGDCSKFSADINVYYTEEINKGTPQYEIIRIKDNVLTIEFYDVENVSIDGFNHQNVIDDLILKDMGDLFSVEMKTIYGVNATFCCKEIAVLKMTRKSEYKA